MPEIIVSNVLQGSYADSVIYKGSLKKIKIFHIFGLSTYTYSKFAHLNYT